MRHSPFTQLPRIRALRVLARVWVVAYGLLWLAAPVIDAEYGHGRRTAATDGRESAPATSIGAANPCDLCALLHTGAGEPVRTTAQGEPVAAARREFAVGVRGASADVPPNTRSRAPPIG